MMTTTNSNGSRHIKDGSNDCLSTLSSIKQILLNYERSVFGSCLTL